MERRSRNTCSGLLGSAALLAMLAACQTTVDPLSVPRNLQPEPLPPANPVPPAKSDGEAGSGEADGWHGSALGLPILGAGTAVAVGSGVLVFVVLPGSRNGSRGTARYGQVNANSNRRRSFRVSPAQDLPVRLAALGHATVIAMVANASLTGVALRLDADAFNPGESVRVQVSEQTLLEAFVVGHSPGLVRLRFNDSSLGNADFLRAICLRGSKVRMPGKVRTLWT